MDIKNLIRLTNPNDTVWMVANTTEFLAYLKEAVAQAPVQPVEMTTFEVGKVPFDDLPEAIQKEVKNTLKAYKRCTVYYEMNQFHASVGSCIRARYAPDHFVCGDYYATDIYTKEERRQNFYESFGYYPVHI